MIMSSKIKRVFVVINPASGMGVPVLHTVNKIFREMDVTWDVGITHSKDLTGLMQKVRAFNPDILAIYGGDGSIAEVVGHMHEDPYPIAIFPGGSANILSAELNIPRGLSAACSLMARSHQFRKIDIGKVNGKVFLLRVGFGIEAKIIENTARDLKNDLGPFAYAVSALKAVFGNKKREFEMTVEGKTIYTEGLSCIVANSGNLGLPNVQFSPTDISDGLLDVFVIRDAHLSSLFAVVTNIITQVNHEAIQHWQVKSVGIKSNPPDLVHYDGELLGECPVQIETLPKRLEVLVPRQHVF